MPAKIHSLRFLSQGSIGFQRLGFIIVGAWRLPHFYLRIEVVRMRHRILFLALCGLSVSSCSQKAWVNQLPEERVSAVAQQISLRDWKAVLKMTARANDPLFLLVRDFAAFQLDDHQKVITSPQIESGPFKSYQLYLKIMAAFESKAYPTLQALPLPDDLPAAMDFRLKLVRAQSFKETGDLEGARKLLLKLLAEARNGTKGDVLWQLADIEWDMGLKDDALKRYRTLYESFPLIENDGQTLQRLFESGTFNDITIETHLQRIQRIQRAAQFSRAAREIKALVSRTPKDQQEPLRLAEAQLAFAQREYTRTLKLCELARKREIDEALSIEWDNLHAWSLIRLGQSEDGRDEYRKLLEKKISDRLRETLLYRLGASAIDDDKFQTALPYFKELREKYGRGRFVESSHWFESWALFQTGSKVTPIDEKGLNASVALLEQLPRLPDGANLEPQSLYWRSKIKLSLQDEKAASSFAQDLRKNWSLSFYSLLLKDKPFDFLRGRETKEIEKEKRLIVEPAHQFDSQKSWQRLEAFRSLHLMEWARFELEIFLNQVKSRERDFKIAVAKRLQATEDWPDLVGWTERNIEKSLSGLDEDAELLKYLYPRAHDSYVTAAAKEFKVSPFLIWGLMREESRFESDVVSHAGAEGLMQLMPQLSKRIGRSLGDTASAPGWMFDSRRNIRFGTYHIRELMDQVNDFPVSQDLKAVLMVASYNAGIDAVKRWVKDQDTTKLDVFIESIPYSETRSYVKRVLQSAHIYYLLYGPPKDRKEKAS